ncbi:MAG: substrate-binding domain-containing protein [Xanthobacteraceae bacterium]|nr:substrate-binding domain-containing protein [Xanthobacteraceae bacterium]
MMRALTALAILFLALITATSVAAAVEIKIFTSRAIATVLEKIGPEFERSTGSKLNVIMGFSPVFVKQIDAGEPFDVIASPPGTINGLVKNGKVIADTRTKLVRSGYGVAVRAGAPKPDVSTTEAFKRTLLNAKSIGYLPTPGLPELLERLGIAEAIKSKLTIPKEDIVNALLAKGDLEVAVIVITQVLTTPGIELAGPLPPDIQIYTSFEGAVSASSKAPDAARALLRFLTGPTAIPIIKAQGMEPL